MEEEPPHEALLQENQVLSDIINELQQKLQVAERRAQAAEAQRSRTPPSRPAKQCDEHSKLLGEKLEKLKRRSVNDRVLLEQATRSRQQLEEQLQRLREEHAALEAAARQAEAERSAERRQLEQLRGDNAELRRQQEQATAELARVHRQLQQLESLQAFEEPPAPDLRAQQREAELRQSLAAEGRRAQELEARCAELSSELRLVQASLNAATLSRQEGAQQGRSSQRASSPRPAVQQEAGARVLDGDGSPQLAAATLQQLAELDDLEGVSHFQCGSPAGSCGSGSASPAAAAWGQSLEGSSQHGHTCVTASAWGVAEAEGGQHWGEAQGAACAAEQQQRQQQRWQAGQLPASTGSGPVPLPFPLQQEQQQHQQFLLQHQQQLEKLQRRNTQLQGALADAHMKHAQASVVLQQEVKALQAELRRVQQDLEAITQQLGVLQAAASAARSNEDSLLLAVERLHEEVVDYGLRASQALEQSAGLMHEKAQWVAQLQRLEQQLDACRAELGTARLQQARLMFPAPSEERQQPAEDAAPAGTSTSQALVPASGHGSSASASSEEHEALLTALLDGQAQEAALRSVLEEVRREQVAACQAVSTQLRRVAALEKFRLADVRECQRLQRRAGELQQEVTRLYAELADARLPRPVSRN